jgi:hypothetical protein
VRRLGLLQRSSAAIYQQKKKKETNFIGKELEAVLKELKAYESEEEAKKR